MSNFENEWYDKGYNDGFSDAINNLEIGDIINYLESLEDEKRQEVMKDLEKYK